MIKVLLKGPVLSRSGYGVQSRFALRSLRAFPERFDVYIRPTIWGATGWTWEDNEERRWIEQCVMKTQVYEKEKGAKYDYSVQVVIPSEFENLATVNVGYTAGIETTKISQKWFMGSMQANGMIVTSNHARYAFDNTFYETINNITGQKMLMKSETPIDVVNYAAEIVEAKDIGVEFTTNFNFLVVAQWSPRKNIEQVIKNFVEEFKENADVGLVLKINHANNSRMDREYTKSRLDSIMTAYKDKKCKVYLMHGDLTDEEVAGLYEHPKIKALVSLTNGEGFNLPAFEATLVGLPVVTTLWGGQVDFIYMPQKDGKRTKEVSMAASVSYDIKAVQPEAYYPDMIIPDSMWCFPKDWNIRATLRDVYKDYGTWKSKAKKLKEYNREKFEKRKMYSMFADCVLEDYNVLNPSLFTIQENNNKSDLVEQIVEYS